jgi:hypothetical protein
MISGQAIVFSLLAFIAIAGSGLGIWTIYQVKNEKPGWVNHWKSHHQTDTK